MVGERSTEWYSVRSKGPVETALYRFHLHVVSQYALPIGVGSWLTKAWIDIAILGRRQERHQREIGEGNSLIVAECEVGCKNWELVHRKAIERVVKDANRPATGYRY